MPVTAVVGAQWGDEGKGRMIDYLAQQADLVIRFQGGDNAGHTVVNDAGRFALHIVPSGIFNPTADCIIGAGTVLHPPGLFDELDALESAGVDTSRLYIEKRAHVVLPYHRLLDSLQETARADGQIRTTKRGIGPTYADKAARTGIRMGDLLDPAYLRSRLEALLPGKNAVLAQYGAPALALEPLLEELLAWAHRLRPRIIDTLPTIQRAVRTDHNVLLEGQLGVMRDLDWGTYPFVTSSNPMVQPAGAGIPARAIGRVIGVVKAYTTAVGAGPFPTELSDDTGRRLREAGQEFGATTGRPRRTGWYDAVAVSHAAWLNGFSSLAITKLDVLDGFDTLKICTGYRLDDTTLSHIPDTPELSRCTPIYETHPGWQRPTTEARHWDDLPEAARQFLTRISELADAPIEFVSVGPERHQLLELPLPAQSRGRFSPRPR